MSATVYVIHCGVRDPDVNVSAVRRRLSDEIVEVAAAADLAGRVLLPGDRIFYVAGFSRHPHAPAILAQLRAMSAPALMAAAASVLASAAA